ncbi:MAG TPA: serine protease [Pirellulaceae bacterium]
MSSPPVSHYWVCANSPGCLRFIRAHRLSAGFLVLAASIFFATSIAPARAQFPIRQMPGPKAPGYSGQSSGVGSPRTVAQSGVPGAGSAQPGVPSSAFRTPQSSALPAVARIVVPEKDGISYGSGTLIDARGQFGLVVSNWHVVRDAAGQITVEFPDGFKSPAEVVKTDKDWDLAALSIYRPRVSPIPVTAVAPQPGESLTIGGYGSGDWRMASGRCTQYLAPGVDFPHEMVELATEARQGDSGGPILNQRGELAGVLFGSGPGYTSGSYGGRVLQFLGTVVPGGAPGSDGVSSNSLAASGSPNPSTAGSGFHSPPPPISPALPQATALRESPPREPPPNSLAMTPAVTQPFDPLLSPPAKNESATRFGPSKSPFGAPDVDPRVAVSPSQHDLTPSTLTGDNHHSFDSGPATSFTSLEPRPRDDAPSTDLHHAEPSELALAIWNRLSGPTLYDQTKTVLAIIGTLSVVILFLRFGSGQKERYHEEEAE